MQARDPRYQKLIEPARMALAQKHRSLSEGGGGFTPIPHAIYREIMPELTAKYDGATARDALTIYMYLQAHAHGKETNDFYMWAYPTVEQIRRDTGIHGDRIRPLVSVLETEGLVVTALVPWMGNVKKLYLPLYYPKTEESHIRDGTDS
ncbi:hypothetical protein [Brevibacillus porteri]|uniref:Replication initiation protein n=1 Tax=Brevibacillus porteri TaxID=2126350 RepID=A0ABX5FHG9_9BACL|nr:hypothetical protein [Brevibacillus porteri]MED1802920.1 hypothetical protein [Brevibacillus porteri]MED2135096.1 hypothetical protein [Brevibacillus porteri]MED2746338.1 hypothetical protein [Brevibacillus porteri]MED2817922.1 hypothetical protein [Brevibacillus porteri]MED2895554.1 hypothetical protein [Brevibacillus porteri]